MDSEIVQDHIVTVLPKLKDGDVLVLSNPDPLTQDQVANLVTLLREHFENLGGITPRVTLIVVPPGAKLFKLEPDNANMVAAGWLHKDVVRQRILDAYNDESTGITNMLSTVLGSDWK